MKKSKSSNNLEKDESSQSQKSCLSFINVGDGSGILTPDVEDEQKKHNFKTSKLISDKWINDKIAKKVSPEKQTQKAPEKKADDRETEKIHKEFQKIKNELKEELKKEI